MKNKFLLTSLFLLFYSLSFTQIVAIDNLKNNVVYISILNPLNIVVEGIPCEDIFVSTNNGKIENEKGCHYNFMPTEIGTALLSVHQKIGKDTILLSERRYRVKPWPMSKPMLGRTHRGKMKLGELKAQYGVLAHVINLDISAKVHIKSYNVKLIRNDEVFNEAINLGARFQEETKILIDEIQVSDVLLIEDILVQLPGFKEPVELDYIKIEVKE